MEGPLYIKTDSRKGWKKYHSVLRASGLYYYKDKASRSPKDLVCLSTFDVNQVYYGVGWKKKYKAPTEHCFGIKHPCLQQPKSTKYVKFVCAEDERTLHKWMSAIRIVKYGQQLVENYETALAGGGLAQHAPPPPPSQTQISAARAGPAGDGSTTDADAMMMRLMDDIESGLSSDSGGSSSGCDVAFESDYPPCGTIKRKPPKLPLTATTRQLACSVQNSGAAVQHHQQQQQPPPQKPVKTVKFAVDHVQQQQQPIYGTHQQQQQRYRQQQQQQMQRTPSLESLPPPPPELLQAAADEPDDVDIMSVVPPPPPQLLSPPSTAFLADLHRVVSKKWTVAQKCKLDTRATPHEVLGFRDPSHDQYAAAGTYSREANVSNWVAEHYGPNNLYENVYQMGGGGATSVVATCSSPSPPPPPPPPGRISLPAAANAAVACAMFKNKRPPPPPPPRSDKTQLTTVSS